MASGKDHNPWLAKYRMFGETLAKVDYGREKVVRSLCIAVNELFQFPLVIFFPARIVSVDCLTTNVKGFLWNKYKFESRQIFKNNDKGFFFFFHC